MDYKDVKLNAHLFHNKEDLQLTKLDSAFDHMVYDFEFFSWDMKGNIELYMISAFLTLCTSIFAAFFNLEFYQELYFEIDSENLL